LRETQIILPNLPSPVKILCTLCLIGGAQLHLLTWDVIFTRFHDYSIFAFNPIAKSGFLFPASPGSFTEIQMLHFAGLLLIAVTSFWLLKRMPLKRKESAITAIFIAALLLSDVSLWVLSPACSDLLEFPEPIVALATLGLMVVIIVALHQLWVYSRWQGTAGKPVHVAIVGGGFGGLYAALALHKRLGYHKDLEITLFDRNNYFLFPPLLPSAAAGILEIRQVSFPFRRIFETMRINFRKVDVSSIDQQKQCVKGRIVRESVNHSIESYQVEHPYDYLVIAPGSKVATYDLPGVEQYAFFLRELRDAIIIRNRVIDLFERAAGISDAEEQKTLLNFVVIGAGATGIEIATELQDLIHGVLLERYLELDPGIPRVTIVQSGTTVLPGWPEDIQKIAGNRILDLGITLKLGHRVKEVKLDCVVLNNEEVLPSYTTIWCAGVTPADIVQNLGLELDESGRIKVDADLRSISNKRIFVLGDAASAVDPRTQKPYQTLAQVALQQGKHTGKNLANLIRGRKTKPFKYYDYGSLVSVGEYFAAVKVMGYTFSGFPGWFFWRTLYLLKLPEIGNQIRIVIEWTLDLFIERSIAQVHDKRALEDVATPIPD
jgi:NADH dehydrogenase